ncbi:MAG: DUF4445 domain-containing protein [Ruminococcaceae bacterium]|nr:DUF4445 domain-containing protein [Oscillospiraceae bacterium]
MFRVKLGEKIYMAEAGESLAALLAKNGDTAVEHLCGGKGTCGKCRVRIDGRDELSCRYEIHSDIEVELYESGEISAAVGREESGRITENLCFALDLGTTTLALALVSLDEGKIVKTVTANNPQRAFGADVMSRIEYCQKHTAAALQRAVVEEVNRLIAQFDGGEVEKLFVAGNTTMLHLFFGVDCTAMGVAPYTPVFLESRTEAAATLGIKGVKWVTSLPSISAFVGADIVAGLHLVSAPPENKYDLLLDLGTNAEIVLYSRHRGLATSAAAGPCFEGANISCGMSATEGAIYAFSLGEDGSPVYKTVGGRTPRGICGTGLVDMIAALLASGIIDGSGYMERGRYPITEDVFLTDADVRQYQLAKAAIHAAILTLMKTEKVSFDDIAHLYIAGGFSAKIRPESAAQSGLLPAALAEKAVPLANAALLGTVKFACEDHNLPPHVHAIEAIDLSASPHFTELFLESMSFS